jgi:hypothetical protein
MNGIKERIEALETRDDELDKNKLDKESYYRDQGALQENMRIMSNDLKEATQAIGELPEKLITLLTNLGKI